MATAAKEKRLTKAEQEFLRRMLPDAIYIVSTEPERKMVTSLWNRGLVETRWKDAWKLTPKGRRLAGRDLRGSGGRGTIATPATSRSRQLAARPQSTADLSTYTGRIGAAVRKRREELGISVEDFTESLSGQGVEVTKHAVYHWEKGLRPIPVNAIPAMAKTLKMAIRELLPAK